MEDQATNKDLEWLVLNVGLGFWTVKTGFNVDHLELFASTRIHIHSYTF